MILEQQAGDRAQSLNGLEAGILEDIIDIAERALWNPVHVLHADMQKLAAAVLAHVHRQRIDSNRISAQLE